MWRARSANEVFERRRNRSHARFETEPAGSSAARRAPSPRGNARRASWCCGEATLGGPVLRTFDRMTEGPKGPARRPAPRLHRTTALAAGAVPRAPAPTVPAVPAPTRLISTPRHVGGGGRVRAPPNVCTGAKKNARQGIGAARAGQAVLRLRKQHCKGASKATS